MKTANLANGRPHEEGANCFEGNLVRNRSLGAAISADR